MESLKALLAPGFRGELRIGELERDVPIDRDEPLAGTRLLGEFFELEACVRVGRIRHHCPSLRLDGTFGGTQLIAGNRRHLAQKFDLLLGIRGRLRQDLQG
ncbi:MAG: hypothetical protein LOD91_09300, partial [Limnochordales bacterium]